MNWCLILSTFLGIPLVIFIKEEFNRSDADEELINDIEEQNVYSETNNEAVIESWDFDGKKLCLLLDHVVVLILFVLNLSFLVNVVIKDVGDAFETASVQGAGWSRTTVQFHHGAKQSCSYVAFLSDSDASRSFNLSLFRKWSINWSCNRDCLFRISVVIYDYDDYLLFWSLRRNLDYVIPMSLRNHNLWS